ncbi:MAG: M23 family metallopeptidase [Prevotellaceae bacterium]|nr:M23 family metallopeptidase [Prevotellaceae bacterium]
MDKKKKIKFRYNPNTLRYESVKGKTVLQKAKRFISFLLFTLVISVIYYFVYSIFFDTLPEYSIKRENAIFAEHLDSLKSRYHKLSEVIDDISRRDTGIYNVIFESKPADVFADANSSSKELEILNRKTNNELIALTNRQLDELTATINKYSPIFDSMKNLIAAKKSGIDAIPSIVPVAGLNINSVGASVGNKMHPIYKQLNVHTGIDFAVSAGSEVIATASGKVKSVVTKQFSTGTEIIIDHENGYETRYLYLKKATVSKNERVKCGEVIGTVGNIGITIPHLHYEVRIDGKIADPLNYFFRDLSPKQLILFATISSDKGQSLD